MLRFIRNREIDLFLPSDTDHIEAQLRKKLSNLECELTNFKGNPSELLDQYEGALGMLHHLTSDVSDFVAKLLGFYNRLKPHIVNVDVLQKTLLIQFRYTKLTPQKAHSLLQQNAIHRLSNKRCFSETEMHTLVREVRKHSSDSRHKDDALCSLAEYYLKDPNHLRVPTTLEQYAKFLILCVIEDNDTEIATYLNAFITRCPTNHLYSIIFAGYRVNEVAKQSVSVSRTKEISLNRFIPYLFQFKLLLAATTYLHHYNESSHPTQRLFSRQGPNIYVRRSKAHLLRCLDEISTPTVELPPHGLQTLQMLQGSTDSEIATRVNQILDARQPKQENKTGI